MKGQKQAAAAQATSRAAKLASEGHAYLELHLCGLPNQLLRAEHALREALQIIETLKGESQ